ncbi:hypothetical protein BgiMline_000988 [Biomphalaria glabrata]|uniref:Uncharacterized protein LOC106065840 n=1 Tax=Biomphalaria glabrata TaxID=6526 RepID=A0A9W2YS89_BIOGL|nr:uncharacterized protein LOC106065840 [Biomphalaria glabrata]KAI8768892.1 DNA-directed RNA polymerase II subunit GRINL1A-like isoform X1 [Biomphalaria glabrata]KAI8789116.1 DNA-directed RNA polymerase II subunit GRINL1A isoform X1 [Biomphalaria glabrata]
MNLTPDRQGYLGDIMTKSIPQLLELLDRQKLLLSKRKFIESLPDKGEKTKKFAEYIQELINLKQKNSMPEQKKDVPVFSRVVQTSLVENLKVEGHPESSSLNSLSYNFVKNTGRKNDDESLKNSKQLDEENPSILKNEHNWDKSISEAIDLADSLEKMSIDNYGDGKCKETVSHFNSYERIMSRLHEERPIKPKFLPNRSLKHTDIPKSQDHKIERSKPQREEESAVRPPPHKFQETKLISIEESVELIELQRAKNEKIAAEWAARKLSEQLVPKMSTYLPTHIDIEYRHTGIRDEEKDSDDEESQDEND